MSVHWSQFVDWNPYCYLVLMWIYRFKPLLEKNFIKRYFNYSFWSNIVHIKLLSSSNSYTYRIPILLTILSTTLISAFSTQQQSVNEPVHDNEKKKYDVKIGTHFDTDQTITNWSNTHHCNPEKIFEPTSAQEVSRILRYMHDNSMKVRPIGTGLSPNGIGMISKGGNLISLHGLDYIEVDQNRRQVTVGAGAKVSDVLKELDKFGLTLDNFSSIQEQQIGGWTQVAAHGTGCTLSTVDEMIKRMQLVTPMDGILTLSDTSNPKLFKMAKVGLGCLGVVTELTLQCIPKLQLEEHSVILHATNLNKDQHYERLSSCRHVRYMWIPYTTTVVSVTSNPHLGNKPSPSAVSVDSSSQPTQAFIDLVLNLDVKYDRKTLESYSFAQLREILLEYDPLNKNVIQRINQAEAKYWVDNCHTKPSRVADSTEILGFDCGGEQFVFEICFPIGSLDTKSNKDVEFVQKLLKLIELNQLPAPSPIEQRWTARSTSPMSPAYSDNPNEIFTWVGVIMYLPPGQSMVQREKIQQTFEKYKILMEPLLDEYKGVCHWAKIELPTSGSQVDEVDEIRLNKLRKQLRSRYPIDEFNAYRLAIDPHGVLSNDLIIKLLD